MWKTGELGGGEGRHELNVTIQSGLIGQVMYLPNEILTKNNL